MINNKQDQVQREAVQAWVDSDKKGTLHMVTGVGKNFCYLHALRTMPKYDQNRKVNLFIAETVERERDFFNEVRKYDEIFGTFILQDYVIKFITYQSAYKLEGEEFGLVGSDEIHFSLSPEYSKFYFNNNYDAIIGLTATTEENIEYIIDNKKITKGDLLNQIAPICYKYSIADAQKDNVGRKLNIFIIENSLDSLNKTIKAGNAKKPFYQTEKSAYDYWDKEHKKSWFIEDKELKDFKIRTTATKRSQILYNLPSKILNVKKLLSNINGKSIVFGNSLDALLKVTSNVISSRNSEEQNKAIREAFDNDQINTIGSFKKLLQGANLPKLDNCILMSYYTSEGQMVQRAGRLRKNGDKPGNVFILLTRDTQEVKWYNSMIQELQEFDFIYCNGIDDCIEQYKLKNEEN